MFSYPDQLIKKKIFFLVVEKKSGYIYIPLIVNFRSRSSSSDFVMDYTIC